MRADGRCQDAHDRFGDIVRRHQNRALRIADRMLRNRADADEVVQDAFVKAYIHLPSFQRQLPFEAWFTRILTNTCRDQLKSRRRRERHVVSTPAERPRRPDFWNSVATGTTSPEDQLLARELRQTLVRALPRLPARQRSVITLSHLEGLTSPEVSELTGWNPSTIRVQLFRGLRSLRAVIAQTPCDI
jgi:RNA polymerase sigma-70 factor (ECF subfamily)